MKYFIYFIILLVLAGIQTGLFSYVRFFGAAPNLLLLFTVGSCLQREAEDAFFVALLAGLFADLQNAVFVGSYSFGFLLLALLIYLLIRQLVVLELNFKYLTGATLLAVLFTGAAAWLVSGAALHFGWAAASVDPRLWRSRLLPELICNIVFCYPLYALATWVHNSILKLQGKKYRII